MSRIRRSSSCIVSSTIVLHSSSRRASDANTFPKTVLQYLDVSPMCNDNSTAFLKVLERQWVRPSSVCSQRRSESRIISASSTKSPAMSHASEAASEGVEELRMAETIIVRYSPASNVKLAKDDGSVVSQLVSVRAFERPNVADKASARVSESSMTVKMSIRRNAS